MVLLAVAALLMASVGHAADDTHVFQHLWSFGGYQHPPREPNGVVFGNDGALYGTSRAGGSNDSGTIFRVLPGAEGYSVLHEFGKALGPTNGTRPLVSLIEGRDGRLYGTTERLEPDLNKGLGGGTIFRINKDGSNYRVLHEFRPENGYFFDGLRPNGRLLQASDGLLYGMAESGGIYDRGTIFRLQTDGGGFQTLHDLASGELIVDPSLPCPPGVVFCARALGGRYPAGGLIEGRDGFLYGVTRYGGEWEGGTIFKVDKNGRNYQTLHMFGGTPEDGLVYSETEPEPEAVRLFQASNGVLYGTTRWGGLYKQGTCYRINPDGTDYRILWQFDVEYRFEGGGSFGHAANPSGPMMEGLDGRLYTTTEWGGNRGWLRDAGWARTAYTGVIFSIPREDGPGSGAVSGPYGLGVGTHLTGGLIQDRDGRFYGVARSGGPNGNGTVFGPAWSMVAGFIPYPMGNWDPSSQLLEGSDGAIYATTSQGGEKNGGTLFKIQKNGAGHQVLHHFLDPGGFAAASVQLCCLKKESFLGEEYCLLWGLCVDAHPVITPGPHPPLSEGRMPNGLVQCLTVSFTE